MSLIAGLALAPAAFAGGFHGTWCGNGLLQDFSLKIAHSEAQGEVAGTLTRNGRVRPVHGSVEGGQLRTQPTKHGSLVLAALGGELRIVDGEGPLALLKGGSFRACGR